MAAAAGPDSEIGEELTCPITLELLEDPITVPCCTRAFSRAALVAHLNSRSDCPLCRQSLSSFNADEAPRSLLLQGMVEVIKNNAKAKPQSVAPQTFDPSMPFQAKLLLLEPPPGTLGRRKQIARVEVTCTKAQQTRLREDTILILALDKSGSMAGGPMNQVNYSLKYIYELAVQSQARVEIVCIAYNNTHSIVPPGRSLSAGGGTSFQAAFQGITDALQERRDGGATSASIVFMTDGHDTSSFNLDPAQFRNQLKEVWPHPVTVHTVGFGASHNFEFLDSLRHYGTAEGAYRYADPSVNSDILCSKINSLVRPILSTTRGRATTSLLGKDIDLQLVGNTATQWLRLDGPPEIEPLDCELTAIDGTKFPLEVEVQSVCTRELWNLWYSNLADELLAELQTLNESRDTYDPQDLELYLLLLQKRTRATLKAINQPFGDDEELSEAAQTGPIITRLDSAMAAIEDMLQGNRLDSKMLLDLRFEGQFATKAVRSAPKAQSAPRQRKKKVKTVVSGDRPPLYKFPPKRFVGGDDHRFALQCPSSAVDAINLAAVDTSGNSPLMVAASCGRVRLIKNLLNTRKSEVSINAKNKYGGTALDLAALYGYWHTCEELFKHGATLGIDPQMVMDTCLSKGWVNTAKFLLANELASVSQKSLLVCKNRETLSWGMNNVVQALDVTIRTSIEKGLVGKLKSLGDKVGPVKFRQYPELFSNPEPAHLKTIEYLLQTGRADVSEQWAMKTDDDEEAQVWPLFLACEKGKTALAKLLLAFNKDDSAVNKQNEKGSTALYVACANGHVDTVMLLIQRGADPNICTIKGDSPLVPACSKGHKLVVQLLLESGADLQLHNKNRDSAGLIACRTGHAEVLELLLQAMTPAQQASFFKTCADIDGFNPFFASTELDRTDCMRLIYKYHNSCIEERTALDNQIIAGGTPLHLACHYGRLKAVKVLHELGADLEARLGPEDGKTPLLIAIQQGHASVVRFLQSVGANMDAVDNYGRGSRYFASMAGNEAIFNEFFHEPLAMPLYRLIASRRDKEKACEILQLHGSSDGVCEQQELASLDLGQGVCPLTLAVLNRDEKLYQVLTEMGADPQQADFRGLTPAFWSALLQNTATEDPRVKRVRAIAARDLQSRMLMSIEAPAIPAYDRSITSPGAPMQALMSAGHNVKVRRQAVEELGMSIYEDHSLLGFLDKINKAISRSDSKLMLWNAQVHVVGSIATLPVDSRLEPSHLLALYLFTSEPEVAEKSNATLAKWGHDETMWGPYVRCLYQALSLLPLFSGECYRKVEKYVEMPIGAEIEWNTFSSCSSDWSHVTTGTKNDPGMIFIIQSINGRPLGQCSKDPQNNQIVFLPGSRFRVKAHYRYDVILFGQANIRASTFTARDLDREKAQSGRGVLVVELEELPAIEEY